MTSRAVAAQTVGLLASIFFVSCISRFGMGPLMPAIESGLHLDHAEAGYIFFTTSLGYCIGISLSELFSSRFNYRNTVIFSSACVAIAMFVTSMGLGFLTLALGMTIVGLAAGLYLPAGLSTITEVVSPANWGKAFAVHEVAPNISLTIGPLIVEAILHWTNWRGVLLAFGATTLLACIVFGVSGRGSHKKSEKPSFATYKAAFTNPSFLLLIVIFSLAIGANVGVYVMLPVYLVSALDFARPDANTIVSFARFFGLVVVFLAGMLTDRWDAKKTMALILLAGGTVTASLGVLTGNFLLVAIFLQPAFAGCFFPVGFTVLSQMGPNAVAICVPIGFLIGAGGIPAAIGEMADAGYFSASMVLSGFLIACGGPLAMMVRSKNQNEASKPDTIS